MVIAFDINDCNWIEKKNGIFFTKMNDFLIFWNKEKNTFKVNEEEFLRKDQKNLVVLNIKTDMEKEIEDIINNSNLYDEIFEYEVLFTEKGFKVISSNNNENKEDDSTIVCWNLSFILEKNTRLKIYI